MSNLHVSALTEIGNSGVNLLELLNRLEKIEKSQKIACYGFSSTNTKEYNTGSCIPMCTKIFDNTNGVIIPYDNGIIDILKLTPGKHFIKCSIGVWIQATVNDVSRPWLQLQNYNKNSNIADDIKSNNQRYFKFNISEIIFPFDPSSDGIMRLVIKIYVENGNNFRVNDGAGGDYKKKNYITFEILEI